MTCNHSGNHCHRAQRYIGKKLVEFEVDICVSCGHWLSLGPSDETAVAVEVKLAAHIQEVCVLWEPKDQDELIGRYVEGFASQPARLIATTESGDEGGR